MTSSNNNLSSGAIESSGLVNVLLATYNGESFLKEQLYSIYKQSYKPVKILVRDDCSVDGTMNILYEEQKEGLLSLLATYKNLGPANNFFTLLKHSNPDAKYFSFSDQDDIWNVDKLERAIKKIENIDDKIPVIYCSSVDYVNESGQLIKTSKFPHVLSFGNALVENVMTGCTMVMNKSARDLIATHIPEKCIMHDSWSYLVASCFGRVIYDQVPGLKYRQHNRNVFGVATSLLSLFKKRLNRLVVNKDLSFHKQAYSFLEIYGNLIPETQYKLLKKFVASKKSFHQRLLLICDREIVRQSKVDTFILKCLIFFNKH
jgi:glycosyltransferase involved in cell wall biosynthesis